MICNIDVTDCPGVGRLIRELRWIRGWTTEELGRRTGSNGHAVSRDERTGRVGTGRLLRYAKALRVKPGLLLEALDEPALLERPIPIIAIQQRRVSARRGQG